MKNPLSNIKLANFVPRRIKRHIRKKLKKFLGLSENQVDANSKTIKARLDLLSYRLDELDAYTRQRLASFETNQRPAFQPEEAQSLDKTGLNSKAG